MRKYRLHQGSLIYIAFQIWPRNRRQQGKTWHTLQLRRLATGPKLPANWSSSTGSGSSCRRAKSVLTFLQLLGPGCRLLGHLILTYYLLFMLCQVSKEFMPLSSLVVGIDLVPIKPIPGAICLQGDITSETIRADIKRELKSAKADVVLHDGTPNVGRKFSNDAYEQSLLTLCSFKLASEFLCKVNI